MTASFRRGLFALIAVSAIALAGTDNAGPSMSSGGIADSPCSSTIEACRDWIQSNHSTDYEIPACDEYSNFVEHLVETGGGLIPVGDNRFFAVRFPDGWEALPDRKLVVSLHGSGGCAERMYQWWSEASEQREYALATLQYAEGESEENLDFDDSAVIYENLLALLDELKSACPVCDVPVILHGFSKGAGRIFEIAVMDRADDGAKAFAAYVADCGTGIADSGGVIPPSLQDASSDAFLGAHFWLYCDEAAETAHICEDMETMRLFVLAHGASVDRFYHDTDTEHGILVTDGGEGAEEALTTLFDYIDSVFQPDVTVNGSDEPIVTGAGERVSIEVRLRGGDSSSAPADWWLIADTPFGRYHYDYDSGGGWQPGMAASHQGNLFDLAPFDVPGAGVLPPGTYTVYFGVDTNMNGALDLGSLYFDSVSLTVQ